MMSSPADWVFGRLIFDSGITLVVPAGNNAADVLGNPQIGNGLTNDSGAIVVGAVTPGFPYRRVGVSNHCSQCDDEVGDNVHVAGWGTGVITSSASGEGLGERVGISTGPPGGLQASRAATQKINARLAGRTGLNSRRSMPAM